MTRTSPGQRAGWCIHYRHGPRVRSEDMRCAAGVRYVDFNGGVTAGMFRPGHMPCFLDEKTGRPEPTAVHCERLRLPTPEEIAEHEAWSKGRFDNLGIVMKGIKPWREKWKGKSHREVVECPACKGRLHLSISAYNGHVHGKCETDDCANWME